MSESFPSPAGDEQESGGNDRRKLGLAAGAGVLLVAVLGYFVVVPALSGDSAAEPVTVVKKAPQTSVKGKADAKAKAKKPAAKKPPAQPESYSDLSSRENPFRPLWVEPKAAAGSTTGAAPSGNGSYQPGQPAPAQPAQPGGQAGGTQSASGGSSTAVGGQRVALMTVYSKSGQSYAQTRVGDVVYTPRVGQVFAVSYKLLAVSGKSATYLYGDEQFTLSVGQEVLK